MVHKRKRGKGRKKKKDFGDVAALLNVNSFVARYNTEISSFSVERGAKIKVKKNEEAIEVKQPKEEENNR